MFAKRLLAASIVVVVICAALPYSARAAGPGADYVRDKEASRAAKACFEAVPSNLAAKRVARSDAPADGEDCAYFMPDGSISIPPGAMVSFKMSGRCMDPHLPAPAAGEPMQFVDTGKLVPQPLRTMYENLVERMAHGDRRVAAANPQHLVWAIRTAGTEEPFAENLSDAQLEILDECAGRRGAFLKYHEKAKRRNARKARKGSSPKSAGRISVGNLAYDAADLRGTNGARRIESHMAELTEMGEKSVSRTASDFRYGEVEEDLYSDIACDGGLSFTARILNASERRREFRAADFAAQVGNGGADAGMRQRVTMGTPDEFTVVEGAFQEGVEWDGDMSLSEIDGEVSQRLRGHYRRRRTSRSGESHVRTERETQKSRRTRTESSTTVDEVPPVPPVPPIVIHDTVTNTVVRHVPVEEDVSVRTVSLEYDATTRRGVLAVEIVSGAFNDVNRHIRANIGNLVRSHASGGDAQGISPDARIMIESMAFNEDGTCKITFRIEEGKKK